MASKDALEQAYLWLKAGYPDRARPLLTQILQQNPQQAEAWIGLSFCVESLQERKECLQHALHAAPQHPYARAALARLETPSKPLSSLPTKQQPEGMWMVYLSLALMVLCLGTVAGFVFVNEKPASAPLEMPTLQAGEYLFLDFYADWCSPCQTMVPVVEALEKECHGSRVHIVKVDVDLKSTNHLQREFNVNSIPRYVLVDSTGAVQYDWVGSGPASRFNPVLALCRQK
ncbi:MAG: hypothetical protein DDG60_06385 [Anaerolineae bacterium]|nr:MAG: hypothetical protein DDG60_06385 [Anaerolineae bacterium]